jgi:hypothetical protein
MNLHYLYNKFTKELFDRYPIRVFKTNDFTNEPPYYLIDRVDSRKYNASMGNILFSDQEPIYPDLIPWLRRRDGYHSEWLELSSGPLTNNLIFVSEISKEVEDMRLAVHGRYEKVVYYFYHALACLDNYREYWKQDIEVPDQHKYLFICYQNVLNSFRWHRIRFQQRLLETGLIDQGLVSYFPPERSKLEEIIKWSTARHHSTDAEAQALEAIDALGKSFQIDTDSPNGSMSTYIDIKSCQSALIHVVSETCFYNGKLHLTEKIFKPIVAKQPFLLLASKGNLAYFKSYGFKTFSDFWDESYDDIEDDNERVEAVVNILQKLSELSYEQQCELRKATQEIVEYNWYHFYYDLKGIVVDELTNNLKTVTRSGVWQNIKTQDIDRFNYILKF